MSRRDVEIVRSYNEPYDGQDLAALIRDDTGMLDLPITRHLQNDVVWDVSGTGAAFFGEVRGLEALEQYWVDWAGLWESYVYRVTEYRDLGDCVLTVADTHVRGRDGMDLDMRVFQIWRVREDKIAVMRAFLSEEDALDAAEAERS